MSFEDFKEFLKESGNGYDYSNYLNDLWAYTPSKDLAGGMTGAARAKRELQDELPALDDGRIPESIRELIGDLEDLDPIEKLNLIHNYCRDFLSANLDDDLYKNNADFLTIIGRGEGSCVSSAALTSDLCRYAGIPPENLTMLAVKIRYEIDDGIEQDFENKNITHMGCVMQIGDDFYFADVNLPHPIKLDPDMTMSLTGPDGTKCTVTIVDILGAISADAGDKSHVSCPNYLKKDYVAPTPEEAPDQEETHDQEESPEPEASADSTPLVLNTTPTPTPDGMA